MMWQDLVFLGGSVFSLIVLAPTIARTEARVPLATSAPSALLGIIYGAAFVSLGMSFSAVGSLATGVMWSLICMLRSPKPDWPRSQAETTTQSQGQPSIQSPVQPTTKSHTQPPTQSRTQPSTQSRPQPPTKSHAQTNPQPAD